MVTCDICNREFKTAQAVNGHKRFRHGVRQLPVAEPATPVAAQNSPEGTAPVSSGDTELAARIQAILEAGELPEGGQAATSHLGDTATGQLGQCGCGIPGALDEVKRQIACGELLEVPGVAEAVAFNREMRRRGRDEAWFDVPEVAVAVVNHLTEGDLDEEMSIEEILASPAAEILALPADDVRGQKLIAALNQAFNKVFPPGWASSIKRA